jgi:hypothetical protein
MFQPLNAKVIAPNYEFNVDSLMDFLPSKDLKDIESKYGKPEVMNLKDGIQLLKVQIKTTNYHIPVMIQVRDNKILDFYAKLPSYFLHDVFFQSLINRLGKQEVFQKSAEEAIYQWLKDDMTHVYSAACTITCFPIFYSVHLKPQGAFKPLIQTLKESVPKT